MSKGKFIISEGLGGIGKSTNLTFSNYRTSDNREEDKDNFLIDTDYLSNNIGKSDED